MEEVVVRGLDEEGPGDIVGAFVNEARIAPEAIGEIDLAEDQAVVELESPAVEPVVDELHGGRSGHSEVEIIPLGLGYEEVRNYVEKFESLVEYEREEEMRRHEQEIRRLSGREREARGRALLQLRGRDEGENLGGYFVKFMRQQRGEPLPDIEIAVGDLVMVSRDAPLREDNPTGTVVEVTNYSLTVAFAGRPPGFVFGEGLRVDLYVNDITYQRMKEALASLPDAEGSFEKLRDVLIGREAPTPSTAVEIGEWITPELNSSQKQAVRGALGSEDFNLIHGPPGSGKTTTLVEVICQAVGQGETVLATAASNTAVDNLLDFLLARGVDVVRVGHPARVIPKLREQTLDARIEDYSDYQKSRSLRQRAFDLLEKQEDLTHPSGRWRRGMSDEKIKKLAEEERGSRGVPPERIQQMAQWLELQAEADQLFAEAEELEATAVDQLLADVDVVCTTNSTAGSELLAGREFDTLVIDEATQATEPSCLIPLTKANRVVLAGDHHQLPPTVLNETAACKGLRRTMFERLAEDYYEELASLLTTQYRMHEKIMDFSSRQFYAGHLEAAATVRTHDLSDLGLEVSKLSAKHTPVLEPAEPLVFVDTSGVEAPEKQRQGSNSRENPVEAEAVADYARSLLAAGINPEDIAVISPYDDQVERLRRGIDSEQLEVDTVDGFQGREKEVVLISLVRSNPSGSVGFLMEPRRFNVAVTRAKRKVIVVGDSSTVSEADVIGDFVDYAQYVGRVIQLPDPPPVDKRPKG